MLTEVTSVNGKKVLVDTIELAYAMNSGFPFIVTDDGKLFMLET